MISHAQNLCTRINKHPRGIPPICQPFHQEDAWDPIMNGQILEHWRKVRNEVEAEVRTDSTDHLGLSCKS